MALPIYCQERPASRRTTTALAPSIKVKRLKKTRYFVHIQNKPLCFVETAPYAIWDTNHVAQIRIEPGLEERIHSIIETFN